MLAQHRATRGGEKAGERGGSRVSRVHNEDNRLLDRSPDASRCMRPASANLAMLSTIVPRALFAASVSPAAFNSPSLLGGISASATPAKETTTQCRFPFGTGRRTWTAISWSWRTAPGSVRRARSASSSTRSVEPERSNHPMLGSASAPARIRIQTLVRRTIPRCCEFVERRIHQSAWLHGFLRSSGLGGRGSVWVHPAADGPRMHTLIPCASSPRLRHNHRG